ncbi:MAG TPA: FtsX-like permease family protein [Candidatus Limnocylindrales bacterium]|nr:FtsX-like permease family protein [Candidatus Limnocylindrales bacterium]
MTRWLGLWRPVAGRARSDWPFLLAVWLLIASATTLLAAGTLYSETVEAGGLRRSLAEAPAEARGVSVRLAAAATELPQIDPPMRSALGSVFGAAGADVVLTLRSSTLLPIGATGSESSRLLTSLGAYEALADHATIADGRWPEPGSQLPEAALSVGAAQALGVAPGERLFLADASTPGADPALAIAQVQVVGIYEVGPDDPYWLGDALEVDGAVQRDGTVFAGPLMIDPADAATNPAFSRAEAGWRALPRVEALRLNQLEQIRSRLAGLAGTVRRALPDDRFVAVNTDLAGVLGTIDRSALVSRGGVVLTTLQFGILAGYAVLLVGGMLAERRRAEVALLRARGASTAEVGFIALGEACLLAVPAALLAPLLAVGVVELIGGLGALAQSGIIAGAQLGEATVLVAIAAGAACVAALTLPALIAEIDLARVRAALGRPLGQTAAQRLGLDLVLLGLAIIGVVQLRSYGGTLTPAAGGRLELDPLLVAAPAIALAAGAILVVRFVPRIGQAAEWLVGRRRGVLGPYAARQAARRPLRYTRSALLVVLAAALGTFGALYSATWTQSQSDQAAHRAGADLRVTRAAHQGGRVGEMAAQLAGLAGVEQLTPAVRAQVDVGRAIRRADLLALDPEAMVQIAELSAAADASMLLGELATDRPRSAALELPAGTRRVSVLLDVAIERLGDGGPSVDLAAFPGVKVIPVVELGDAAPHLLPLQQARFGDGERRLVFDLPDAPHEDARLVAVDMHLGTPAPAIGDLRLLRVEASPSAAGDDWTTVVEADALEDWSIIYRRSSAPRPGTPITGAPTHDFGGPLVGFTRLSQVPRCLTWISGDLEGGCRDVHQDLYRWSSQASFATLPAIASDAFLAASGSAVGDDLTISWFGAIEVRMIGRLASFPSLDPQVPFLIIDRATLNRLRSDRQLDAAVPTEWWLRVDDAHLAEIESAARRPPIAAAEVVSRDGLTRTLQRDPLALGLVGALLLGSLAAAAFAALGLIVTAVVSARERIGEVALLRALGVSRRQVVALLSIEQGFLLGLGLLAGAGLGGLIAVLVLPQAPLNRSGAAVVPPPEIVVPWGLAALVVVGGLVVLGLSVLAARREIVGRSVVDVLRERED